MSGVVCVYVILWSLSSVRRCSAEIQGAVGSLTFEDLVTTPSGVVAARALVNILIDEQIGQQIGVRTQMTWHTRVKDL